MFVEELTKFFSSEVANVSRFKLLKRSKEAKVGEKEQETSEWNWNNVVHVFS